MKKNYSDEFVDLYIEDGILIGYYKAGLKINLEMAKLIVKNRVEFTNGISYPTLVFNHGVISIDKEARDFLSSDEGVKGLKAGAIIVDSPFTSFLSNFYLKVSKPKIPSRLFTNKEDAIIWLQRYK